MDVLIESISDNIVKLSWLSEIDMDDSKKAMFRDDLDTISTTTSGLIAALRYIHDQKD